MFLLIPWTKNEVFTICVNASYINNNKIHSCLLFSMFWQFNKWENHKVASFVEFCCDKEYIFSSLNNKVSIHKRHEIPHAAHCDNTQTVRICRQKNRGPSGTAGPPLLQFNTRKEEIVRRSPNMPEIWLITAALLTHLLGLQQTAWSSVSDATKYPLESNEG